MAKKRLLIIPGRRKHKRKPKLRSLFGDFYSWNGPKEQLALARWLAEKGIKTANPPLNGLHVIKPPRR